LKLTVNCFRYKTFNIATNDKDTRNIYRTHVKTRGDFLLTHSKAILPWI